MYAVIGYALGLVVALAYALLPAPWDLRVSWMTAVPMVAVVLLSARRRPGGVAR